MFGEVYTQTRESVTAALDRVDVTGEPYVFLSLRFVGDMETLMEEARSRGVRVAGFPDGGITLLPKMPVTENELIDFCVKYCQTPTADERATFRRDLYLREYPLFTGSMTAATAPLFHPADVLIKFAELCCRVVEASPAELAQMMNHSPYLHVAHYRAVFEVVRAHVRSTAGGLHMANGVSPENGHDPLSFPAESRAEQTSSLESGTSRLAVDFRDLVNHELDQAARLGSAAPHGTAGGADVQPDKLFAENAVEEEARGDEEPLADLTGQEKVDHVKSHHAEYLQESDFDIVRRSGIFYNGEGDRKRIAAIYVAGAFSIEKCQQAAKALAPAATKKNMRALTNGGELPDTGIVGYYDYLNNPTQHKCRETSYMRHHLTELMEGCAPLMKDIDEVYKKAAPIHYDLQRVAIPTQFQLFGTVFSTITVNHNFRTAVHTDSGDFRSGLGVLTVVDGTFSGCHLAIKKLKKAFRMQVGDVLLFDTSLEHGNTEVHDAAAGWSRVSLVCYLRNGLMSAVCELERRKHLNRLIVSNLANAVGHSAAVNINSVDETLPPLYVPARLASKLGTAQLSALTFVSERAQKNSGCVLAMTMGLGKTLVALTLCYSYLHQFPHRDILVLVPKPIIRHWMTEYKKWSSYGLRFNHLVASEDQSTRDFEEGLYRYDQQLNGLRSRWGHVFLLNPEYVGSFLKRFSHFDPVVIIADEGHKMAAKGSKLTSILSRLRCPLRVVLSGTPMQNNAEELYRLVGWVNSGVQEVVPPRVFNELAADITRYIKGDDSVFHEAVLAQRYIQDWMKGFVFREMESDLPPLYDYILVCGSSATQKRIETAVGASRNAQGELVIASANDFKVYHLSTHPLCYWGFVTGGYQSLLKGTPFGRVEREAQQRARLTEEELDEIEGYYEMVRSDNLDAFTVLSGKLAVLVKIVMAVRARGEKLIIFSQYIGTQDLIHRTLTAYGISVFSVRGRDSQDRRRDAMEQFATDSSLTTLILSTKIAAFGLDFTAANHVVLFDSWWNPQVDAQAVARAYRRNQTRPVTVYRLASEAEDRSVLSVQTRKTALFNCIMHEKTSRSAQPGEIKDCTDQEEDVERRALWHELKAQVLEGGFPALLNVYRHTDSIKEVDPLAPGPLTHKRPRDENASPEAHAHNE